MPATSSSRGSGGNHKYRLPLNVLIYMALFNIVFDEILQSPTFLSIMAVVFMIFVNFALISLFGWHGQPFRSDKKQLSLHLLEDDNTRLTKGCILFVFSFRRVFSSVFPFFLELSPPFHFPHYHPCPNLSSYQSEDITPSEPHLLRYAPGQFCILPRGSEGL